MTLTMMMVRMMTMEVMMMICISGHKCDIDNFDQDNDSKSEVNHMKKVNDEPQKETRKRKALDTAEDESPKTKVSFIFSPSNSCLALQNVE